MRNLLQNLLIVLSVMVLAISCYNEDNKIPESCADGIMNQDETGIDCGGSFCPECPPSCNNGILDWSDSPDGYREQGLDCGARVGGVAVEGCAPCCTNGIQDSNPNDPTLNESYIDCRFEGLAAGQVGSNNDCPICETCSNGVHDVGENTMVLDDTGVLVEVLTVDCDNDPDTPCPPCILLCDDGLLNGAEGDCGIDCGGVCLGCDITHCSNGILDVFPDEPGRSETAIDCGGCDCEPCELLCFDGILNGTEEAIDCGGAECLACNNPVLCNDGIQNGYETGVDCYDAADPADAMLSACPSCFSLCTNTIFDGNETDTDCGGPDCGPCGSPEVGFMTYFVNGVFYESRQSSLSATFLPGTPGPTPAPDVISVQGGDAHEIRLYLKDTDVAPNNFSESDFTIDAVSFAFDAVPDTLSFTDNDALFYNSDNQTGTQVNVTNVEFNITGVPNLGFVEGSFSGELRNSTGGVVSVSLITDGQFKVFFE